MRESKFKADLVKDIADLGGVAESFVVLGKKGPPDLLVSWPRGHFLDSDRVAIAEFIETKVKGGKLEPWQERDHARRRTMGFKVHVIWNQEQADAYLRSRGKK